MMMTLKELQHGFVQQLIKPELQNNFVESLCVSGNLQPEQQLAIYQSNMRAALQQTLVQIYPVCHNVVGDAYFKQLARSYIREQPSHAANLNHYGESFSDFLRLQCQQRSELVELAYLADLAQLEWLYHAIYYVEQGTQFDLSAFTQLTLEQQENCCFLLSPQLTFSVSDYPVVSIWQLNQPSESSQQSLPANMEHYAVFREHNKPKIMCINEAVYQLLIAIKAGKNLTELSAMGGGVLLSELIQTTWVVGFTIHHV